MSQIYVDFHNLDPLGRVRLNTVGTIRDLASAGIVLQNGVHLQLISDEWRVSGVAEYSEDESVWTARFAAEDLENIS